MTFGILTETMKRTLAPFIEDKVVWDIGAGDLTKAKILLDLGAAHIGAVDKRVMPDEDFPRGTPITTFKGYLNEIGVPLFGVEVLFLSWPVTRPISGIVSWLEVSDVVVYLGSNTGGNACGPKYLFKHFEGRELLAHVPHRRNSLLVFGQGPRTKPLTGEEMAALSGTMVSFEEAEDEWAR